MYIIYDDFYLKHENGPGHPENAGRLISIKKALDTWEFKDRIIFKKPRPATVREIEMAHDRNYIKRIENLSGKGGISYLDPDTAVTEYTYDCALLAAGGCFTGIDLIFNGKSDFNKFFGVIRPPGHHASGDRGRGFCIFNNIALSAKYARLKYNIKKIAIIDFDAHHGNGTQEFFYEDSSVFYVSFHQYPHYPGTGNLDETGSGEGRGFNLNFPFAPQTGEADYLTAMLDIIATLMEKYRPGLLLVSAGYDSHLMDPLASLGLVDGSYYKIMYIISYLSSKYCDGRLGIMLEGGYEHNYTARSVLKTIEGCAGKEDLDGIRDTKDLEDRIKAMEDFRVKEVKNGMVFSKIKEIFKV